MYNFAFFLNFFLSLSQWMCQFCTYVNTKPSAACEMCDLSCKDSSGFSLPQSLQQTPSSTKDQPPQTGVRPQPKPRLNLDLRRQKMMREDGLLLIHQIRVGPQPHVIRACICCSILIKRLIYKTS